MKNVWFIACCLLVLFTSAQTTTHKVVKGETLYAIAKQHHVKVAELARINNLGDEMKVKPGQVLKLPKAGASPSATTSTPQTESKPKPAAPKTAPAETAAPKAKPAPTPAAPTTAGNSARIIHEVQKGETLYAIAKSYGVKVSLLKELNQLDDDLKIKLGQKLLIRVPDGEAMYQKPAPAQSPMANPEPAPKPKETETKPASPATIQKPVAPAVQPVETPGYSSEAREKAMAEQQRRDSAKSETATPSASANPDDYETLYNQYATQGKSKRTIRGLGTFLHSSSTPGNQFLALYNYAETGSIIKITNLMSKRTIYVKVIGKVPGNEAQTDVVLKVSQQAADVLKVSEEKFLVEVAAYN
ncbi:MAG: LysM peptidoglycan-binding domain-containing protein [Chitinophagales bacterium]